MDPLSGLSLACNIMQVVQFGCEALSAFRDFRDGKAPAADVAFNQAVFTKVLGHLQSNASSKMSVEDQELEDTAREARRIGQELQKQLEAYKPRPSSSKRGAVSKSFWFMVSGKGKIKALDGSLRHLEETMEMQILVHQK
jgi:hypothetical protein